MFTQHDSIKKLWITLPEDSREVSKSTTDRVNLFKVDEQEEKLSKDKIEKNHSATAKCLCLSQRTRVDMQMSTGFYCTRVKAPDVEDWGKCCQLSGFLWSTRFLPLVMSIDG